MEHPCRLGRLLRFEPWRLVSEALQRLSQQSLAVPSLTEEPTTRLPEQEQELAAGQWSRCCGRRFGVESDALEGLEGWIPDVSDGAVGGGWRSSPFRDERSHQCQDREGDCLPGDTSLEHLTTLLSPPSPVAASPPSHASLAVSTLPLTSLSSLTMSFSVRYRPAVSNIPSTPRTPVPCFVAGEQGAHALRLACARGRHCASVWCDDNKLALHSRTM